MSAQCETTVKKAGGAEMGFFERYLTAWVFACIVVGIALGHFFNGAFQAIGALEIARVNLPVAVLVWLMIIPMLLKIDLHALKGVTQHWRGVGVTLSQVALNDVIMVFAFAPIVGLLLGLSAITVPWDTLLLSVLVYIVVPLVIANLWRNWLLKHEHGYLRLQKVLDRMHPVSLSALLATLMLLFGFQGEQIIQQPLIIALLAVLILIQVFFNSGLAYLLNRAVRSPHCVAGPSALIGASNFFELAVATAIALFGFQSGAALATVVGVLIEVPVMLAAVGVVNRTRGWYEAREGVVPHEQCCPADLYVPGGH
jgi:ACR3 family arsenite transporter